MNIGYGQMAVGGSPGKKRHEHDFYATSEQSETDAAVDAVVPLLRAYFPNRVWENACGDGKMVKALQRNGFDVVATDLVNRGCGRVQDFLTTTSPSADAVVTNPPFDRASEFIHHALFELGVEHMALFLKATFYHAKERLEMFETFPPNIIAPLTFRVDFSGQKRPTMETSWYIWSSACPFSERYMPLRRLTPKPRRTKK